MRNLKLLTWVLIIGFISACSGSEGRGYKTTESGLKYKIIEKGEGEKAEVLDILSMNMIYRLEDSVLFDTRMSGMPMYLELTEPEYPGDIYEGLALLSVGDSASFIIDAEKFFTMTAGVPELPQFITAGDVLHFDVRLNKAMDEAGFMEEQERMMEERVRQNEQRAQDEGGLLEKYIADQGITESPRPSGLYFVEKEKGSGPKVNSGQVVSVHYEGRLLDGTVFDSSYDRGTPLEFQVGAGQVIPGWDEGISLMNVGGKALLVIPSFLGYGERGAGQSIPPYSSLVFEVEVVGVK